MTQHRQNTRTRKSTKRSARQASKTELARGHHRLTVGPTMACGGGRSAVRPGWHGCASLPFPNLQFSFVRFRLPTRFVSVFAMLPLKRAFI